MSFRIPDSRIPETDPWADREFLEWAIHEQGLSARTIAFELDTEESRITIHAERLGVIHPHRHEPTLRRLHVEEGLSPEELSARDEFDVTPTTVRKYLAEYGISEDDPDDVSYGRLDELGRESPSRA